MKLIMAKTIWNDDWRIELEKINCGCMERLCECRNTKADIKRIAKIMYKYNSEHASKEDCLNRTLEWVCAWNSQYDLLDSLTNEEYYKILDSI